MASQKDKKYPPGQKPVAKPTMAQAFQAAQGPAVARPTKPSPGSAAANREAVGNIGKSVVNFFAKGGIPAVGKPEGFNKPSSSKPIPKAEQTDLTAQAKAKDKKANTARMVTDAKYDKVGPKAVVKATTKAAKPYVKLKQAPREAARRAYVQKQLDRLGIKPTPAGKPRSAAEKAARVKARATWDKKNKFQKKSTPMPDSPKQSGWTGPGPGPTKNKPEA
jgi:hypothetical protein